MNDLACSIDGVIILNPDGTIKRPKSESVKYDGEEYRVLELAEVVSIINEKGRANVLHVVADGDEIISANLVLGMQHTPPLREELQSKMHLYPEDNNTINITFTAFTEKDKQ